MRLAKWLALSRLSEGAEASGDWREHAGGDGSGGGESCGAHRKPGRTGRPIWALEAPHGPVAAFDAAVVLLQPVVQVGTGPVPHTLAEFGPDRAGVAVVAVRRDPVRCHPGDRLGGAEERLGGCHIPVLTEQHVDQGPVPVDGAIEIAPAALHFQVRLIHVPAVAYPTAPAPPQLLGQGRRELVLPLPNR